MLALSYPTTLDGYQFVAAYTSSHDGGGGLSGIVVLELDAPSGKQFLGGAGSLVVLDGSGGSVIDVLPVAAELIGSSGANCIKLVVTANVPDDSRFYTMAATGVVVTQPLNPGH